MRGGKLALDARHFQPGDAQRRPTWPAESGTTSIPRGHVAQDLVKKLCVVLFQQFGLASGRETRLNVSVILQFNRSCRGLAGTPLVNFHLQGAGIEDTRRDGQSR